MKNFDPIEILIVEDNSNDAELMIRALRQNNLVNGLYLTEDGQEALDFIYCKGQFATRNPTRPLRVIFLDLKLPKISGLEVLKKIKSDPLTRKLPVIIISSSKEDSDIEAAYEFGANSYVVKPVVFDEFALAIQNTGLFWLLVNESPSQT